MVTSSMSLAARLSLSFLWIFTGITSAFFAKDVGYEVLANGGITGTLANLSILSGSVLDVVIGAWLLVGKRLKVCYLVQMVVVILYTLLLTAICDPIFKYNNMQYEIRELFILTGFLFWFLEVADREYK